MKVRWFWSIYFFYCSSCCLVLFLFCFPCLIFLLFFCFVLVLLFFVEKSYTLTQTLPIFFPLYLGQPVTTITASSMFSCFLTFSDDPNVLNPSSSMFINQHPDIYFFTLSKGTRLHQFSLKQSITKCGRVRRMSDGGVFAKIYF